jgi:outer membrane protein TolC
VTPHVEHAFDVARVAYASNRGEFADLLDTERVLLSTRMDVVAARADVERAIADLAMATGDIPEN